MIIEETSCVECPSRRYDYPNIYWLTKNHLNETKYHPIEYNEQYIAINGLYSVNETKNTFIGSIQSSKLSSFHYLNMLDEKIYTNDEYFLLSFTANDCYYWHCLSDTLLNLPRNALRATLNHNLCEYLYIGKDMYENIGTLVRSDKMIYTTKHIQRIDAEIENVSILCLKVTPTTLKNLCKLHIHSHLKNNHQINELSTHLPTNLVNFLKYPSFLTSGECLLKGEKLMSSLSKGVLEISHENKIKHLNCETSSEKILYDFVDSIWIYRNFVAINRFNNAFVFFIYLNRPVSNILLDNDQDKSEYGIKFLLNNKSQLVLCTLINENETILKQFNI